jgi:hypothetical protein
VSAIDANPPKREIGAQTANSGQVHWPNGPVGWSAFTTDEHVPELTGQHEIETYDRMLTNPQVWALFMGMMLPVLDYDYAIEPGDADPAMTQVLADDLGLPVGLPAPGDNAPPLAPGAYRFNFLEHLWEALFAPAYGRYYFEQVGEVVPDDGLWHLRRLAPRAPHDISDIITDDDGGLVAIMHPGVERQSGLRVLREVAIPVSQLLAYVWLPTSRRRWVGRSMLRPCYEPWVLRDRGVRVDMINHERAGGVPGIETDESWQGDNLDELRKMASAFRVGEDSGSALPPGAHLKIARVGGTDVVSSLRYHDESMARAWGSMVRQLGTTATGSRALGDTMEGMEAVIRRAIVRWFAGTFREHMIEDWWSWNVGPTPHPSLAWRPRNDGVTPIDPEAEPPNPPRARLASPAGRLGGARREGQRRTGRADGGVRGRSDVVRAAARLPNRPLRREPFEHEVRAAVDFAGMDVAYEDGLAATDRLLADTWLPDLVRQAEDAVTFTKKGTERKRLTRLDAARVRLTAPDPEPLVRILMDAARSGAAQAIGELGDQGVSILSPSDDELLTLVRDHAQAVAQQAADGVSLAASRRAVQVNAGRAPGEVAREVSAYLRGLEHRWEADQLRGAVQQAVNAARLQVFDRVPSERAESFYASELLDSATCGPCAAVDGLAFAELADAHRLYPTGGYVDCLGGPRCRGTVVAVMRESEVAPGTPSHLGPG